MGKGINNWRKFLRWSLWMGVLGFASILPHPLAAMIKPGVGRLRSDVQVNRATAELGQIGAPGDILSTENERETVVVFGTDAYFLRPSSELIFPKKNTSVKILTIVSGRILSILGPGKLTVDTQLATIGIRGTGVYVEITPDRNYVCLCYGQANLQAKLNPAVSE